MPSTRSQPGSVTAPPAWAGTTTASPWYLRDLSTLGTAAVVGGQDGRPVVFLPQALGVPDDAAGYVYLNADPAPDLTVDLFGAPVRVVSGAPLGGGWWYLRAGDEHFSRTR